MPHPLQWNIGTAHRYTSRSSTPACQPKVMAFTMISGMTTLVATAPNLVVNSELERHGVPGFSFFSFTPFGLPILVLGIIYMTFARRWLRAGGEERGEKRAGFAAWIEEYKLAEREYRVRVTPQSPLAGKTLEELNLRSSSGASIVAVERSRKFSRELLSPTAKTEIKVEDVLLIDLFSRDKNIKSREMDIEAIEREFALEELPLSGAYFTDRAQEIGMAEVIVPPSRSSWLVGSPSHASGPLELTVIGSRGERWFRPHGPRRGAEGGRHAPARRSLERDRQSRPTGRTSHHQPPREDDDVVAVPGKAIQAVG